MSFKGFKSVLWVLPVCLSLLACSGGGGGAEGGADGAAGKLNAIDRRVTDWGNLVGLEPAAAQDALDQAGLLDQVGKDAALNEAQAQAFFELTHAKDKNFSQGIDELNRRNQKAFLSFLAALSEANDNLTIQPTFNPTQGAKAAAFVPLSPELPKDTAGGGFQIGPDVNIGDEFIRIRELRQTALDDYASMTSQAFVLRGRLLDGARALGFGLQPATMQEILDDVDFNGIRNAFAKPVVKGIFTTILVDFNIVTDSKETNPASQQQILFAAEPLADVTFKIGGRFISFYQFNAVVINSSQAPSIGLTSPGPNGLPSAPPPPASRGAFSVIAADANAFFNQGQDTGLVKEEIKK